MSDSSAERVDVLVVEDEPDVASSTADIFRSEGLNATIAATVEEALTVLATYDVRSIILDHQIVDNGDSLLAEDRHLPPVIVMSGMDRDELEELQNLHGARLFACLTKPVPPSHLIDVVKSAIAECR